jgi:hypothetical protein
MEKPFTPFIYSHITPKPRTRVMTGRQEELLNSLQAPNLSNNRIWRLSGCGKTKWTRLMQGSEDIDIDKGLLFTGLFLLHEITDSAGIGYSAGRSSLIGQNPPVNHVPERCPEY